MRILTVSDKVEPVLYGPYIRERVGKIDLVLACGDLPYEYLEYIVSLLDAQLYYVHGNHDRVVSSVGSFGLGDSRSGQAGATAFTWAVNLHGRTKAHEGLLLAGLEGCRVYNPGAPFQYRESEVRSQVTLLGGRLGLNRLRYGRYLDVLITHAPPRGIHDAADLPHQGFASYLTLLRTFRPALMVHGHSHLYNHNATVETAFEGTRIINTYGYRVLELAQQGEGRGWRLVRSGR